MEEIHFGIVCPFKAGQQAGIDSQRLLVMMSLWFLLEPEWKKEDWAGQRAKGLHHMQMESQTIFKPCVARGDRQKKGPTNPAFYRLFFGDSVKERLSFFYPPISSLWSFSTCWAVGQQTSLKGYTENLKVAMVKAVTHCPAQQGGYTVFIVRANHSLVDSPAPKVKLHPVI